MIRGFKAFSLFMVAISTCIINSACRPPAIESPPPAVETGTGTLIGVVVDAPLSATGFEILISYEEALKQEQKYAGALVQIHHAVASGTYRVAEGQPERKLYTVGEKVAEIKTGGDGTFQVDLPAGNYFIRVFYGERSYSGDLLIDLEENGISRIGIGLIHGI